MTATTNHADTPCYSFSLSQAGSEVDILLDAKGVEIAVAEKMVINPVLEGAHLYLQFHSYGGALEDYSLERGSFSTLLDLVEGFTESSDLHEQPELFAEAIVELHHHLRFASRMVYAKARDIDALPDPLKEDYMPKYPPELEQRVAEWERTRFGAKPVAAG